MHTLEEALARVLAAARPLPPRDVALADALGLVLADEIASDIDSPPHDKALVDGYAVRADDLRGAECELAILEELTAGETPRHAVGPGQCSRIMTGAPLPAGADGVVMIERSEPLPPRAAEAAHGSLGRVRLREPAFTPGQNVLRRAAAIHRGEVVLGPGHRLRPAEIGLLAEIGRARVRVTPRPRVAVLATGNELVPIDAAPPAGKIRNSNEPMLAAAVRRVGGEPVELGVARDEPEALAAKVHAGLRADVLVLSGGVSAGVLDLVPAALRDAGVEPVFHKVRLKPGKPLWFGVAPRQADRAALPADPTASSGTAAPPRLVFGLPGNPVSSLVCFELFVRPALARLAGWPSDGSVTLNAILAREFTHRGERPTYQPATIDRSTDDALRVTPLDWHGSADLRTLARAEALIAFPAGDHHYVPGEPVVARLLD